ncbi:hypothetical protein [uncultured Muribaculum sp.]|uniref:hypothetical protein n=3 Tax=uncultured Muribaculum sp. TaxID=1918613 RepID=UPI0025A5D52D|nr:hypothetical protein [uncultured Muribaculum sp.]
MKPIWYIIGVGCVLISAIGRMANSLTDVLIAVGVIAVVALVIWLFETGKIRMNERLGKILKKICGVIFVAVGIAYLVALAGFIIYKFTTEGDCQGIFVLGIACVTAGVSWYISRWRRRWVKFLKTFMPKDKIRHGDWKLREKYFWTFDYTSNAQYGLRSADGIFDGQARVWLDPSDVDKDASARLDSFEEMLAKRGIKANCALTHIPGCIYADIVAETNYKSMNSDNQDAFRDAFHELDGMNYQGDYYAEYHGELGTIIFESNAGNAISRAIRTEPREEHYIDNDCGFQSEEAHYFIERGVDWTDGTYSLITAKEFFALWRERLDYNDKDDAYSFFEQASLMYFAAAANGDKKEQANSRWDIENAAKYLISHDAKDEMIELMAIYEQSMYWASRLFVDVIPEYAYDTANRLVEYSDNPYIVSRTKRLIAQWKKGGKL